MHDLGFIHGRFQVVHNDHMAYLLEGKRRCRHLVVGITNPDEASTCKETADPNRSDPANNPFTYAEREAMVHAALSAEGVPADSFEIIPFPICLPEQLKEVAPPDAVYFLTIYDEWGRAKKERFESLGLKTEVMWEKAPEEKGITGSAVRKAIRLGQPWSHLVPPAVAELLLQWEARSRILGND